MFSMVQVNRIYLIFNPVHFLVDSSVLIYMQNRMHIAVNQNKSANFVL